MSVNWNYIDLTKTSSESSRRQSCNASRFTAVCWNPPDLSLPNIHSYQSHIPIYPPFLQCFWMKFGDFKKNCWWSTKLIHPLGGCDRASGGFHTHGGTPSERWMVYKWMMVPMVPPFQAFQDTSIYIIYLVGGPGPPLWKIWVRQLGWLEIPNIWENMGK